MCNMALTRSNSTNVYHKVVLQTLYIIIQEVQVRREGRAGYAPV